MFKKTLSAIMAVSLLSSFAIYSMEDETLRGGRSSRNSQCVRGTIFIDSAQVIALNKETNKAEVKLGQPSTVPVAATQGSGFTIPCNADLTCTNYTTCYQTVNVVNGQSDVFTVCITIPVSFKCPLPCIPTVLTSLDAPCSPTAINCQTQSGYYVILLNSSITSSCESKCGFTLTLCLTLATGCTNNPSCSENPALADWLNANLSQFGLNFDAVVCSSCCTPSSCTTLAGKTKKNKK